MKLFLLEKKEKFSNLCLFNQCFTNDIGFHASWISTFWIFQFIIGEIMFNTHKPSENDLPTSSQLLKSTMVAICVGCALLILFVLPAEYGTDPTGVGELFGLKKNTLK